MAPNIIYFCQASVCSLVLSWHNKDLEWWTLKPFGLGQTVFIAPRQISVTALFYLENSKRIRRWSVKACWPKDAKRREWGRAAARGREKDRARFGSSFYMFFSSPWACPMQVGPATSAVCFTWSPHSGPRTFLWPSFVLFSWAFPFLVF